MAEVSWPAAAQRPSCLSLTLVLLALLGLLQPVHVQYTPDWESLDSRPLPAWYDEGKIGIFIHWGVFSVPSFGSEWFVYNWNVGKYAPYVDFMKNNYPPGFTYGDFAPQLTAEFFDANQWAEVFKASGAKYIVFVSKHCEGYTNWPSETAFNWNSMDVGPKRDIVGELEKAIRTNTDLRFGLYHCLYEWVNPLYLQDKANNWTTSEFVKTKILPALHELVEKYNPDIVWSDGDWEAPDTYWQSKEFLTWLYNDSPVKDKVMTNDRWGIGTNCTHGGTWTCGDRYNPGHLMPHKWVQAMTLDKKSWGFRRNAPLSDYLTIHELLLLLSRTVSCGGNLLVNVGPTKSGIIDVIFEERLRQMGQWLQVNGEAIYGTKPWTCQNDSRVADVWYTAKMVSATSTTVYALFFDWPKTSVLHLGCPLPSPNTKITLVGYDGPAEFTFQKGTTDGLYVNVPSIPISALPSTWGWALKMEMLSNQKTVHTPAAEELWRKLAEE